MGSRCFRGTVKAPSPAVDTASPLPFSPPDPSPVRLKKNIKNSSLQPIPLVSPCLHPDLLRIANRLPLQSRKF